MNIKFNNVYVQEVSTVAGPFVIEGPLKDKFDKKFIDFYDGEKTFEMCEMKELQEDYSSKKYFKGANEEQIEYCYKYLLEEAKKIANGRGSNEIVIIDAKIDTNGVDKDSSSEQVYKLLGIQVYNMETKEIEKIKLEDHEILTETLQA